MRYLDLWCSFLKASWISDLEYRTNIVVKVLGELIWYLTQLSVFEVLYTHTQSISGWDVRAMRVFMGSLFLVDNIYMILCAENMESFNSFVRKGELDLYLVKPVNSQFMVSFRKVSVVYLLNLVLILGYLGWTTTQLDHVVLFTTYLAYVFLVICGAVCYYSLRFLFATISVVLQDAGSMQFIWHQLFRLATRPDPIYPSYLRFLVLTLFPVGFFASVPSRVLVEGPTMELLWAPIMAGSLLWVSHLGWERALKKYSSASS